MSTTNPNAVQDRELERKGKRMEGPAIRFLGIALALAVIGVIVIVFGPLGVGAVFLLLACIPAAVAVALLLSSGFARWAARHKLFA
jgi:Flp pilus assembly protein TadB